jgi:hypothetical protein
MDRLGELRKGQHQTLDTARGRDRHLEKRQVEPAARQANLSNTEHAPHRLHAHENLRYQQYAEGRSRTILSIWYLARRPPLPGAILLTTLRNVPKTERESSVSATRSCVSCSKLEEVRRTPIVTPWLYYRALMPCPECKERYIR